MKILRTLFLFLSVLAIAPAILGQSATFEWDDEFCTFKGTYDPSKISEERIRETRELIEFGIGLPLQTDQTVFDIKDLGTLDVDALDAEYRAVRQKLESLRPVDNAFFRDLRQRHLKTLDASYRLKRITLLAHTKPITLVFGNNHEECFSRWGKPVIDGGQSLLAAWRTLTDEQKLKNASPEGVEARYRSRYNSPQRDKWALVEVLGFGWWNCVNDSIPYVESDGSADEEFGKLFSKVESECDEP